MKKVYFLDSWILFLFFLAPYILQNSNKVALTISFFSLSVLWFFKLTLDIYKRLPGGHGLNLKKFMFHFLFPATYFSIILVTIGGYKINSSSADEYGDSGPILVALHLFSMYCIFYCFYFSAKALAAVYYNELNPSFSSYVGSFLSFWFLPIGIWFLQPKIKKVFGQKPATNSQLAPPRTRDSFP